MPSHTTATSATISDTPTGTATSAVIGSSTSTGAPAATGATLSADQHETFDAAAKTIVWELTLPDSAPFRTRLVRNPHATTLPRPHGHTAATGLAAAVFLTALAAYLHTHHAPLGATLALTAALATLTALAAPTLAALRGNLATGTGPRLRVPQQAAIAHAAARAITATAEAVHIPHQVADYLTDTQNHMDRLLAQSARLHRQRLSTTDVGRAVTAEMFAVAADATTLLDTALGNPASRTEAVAWQQTSATLAAAPAIEDEDHAIAAAFAAAHTITTTGTETGTETGTDAVSA